MLIRRGRSLRKVAAKPCAGGGRSGNDHDAATCNLNGHAPGYTSGGCGPLVSRSPAMDSALRGRWRGGSEDLVEERTGSMTADSGGSRGGVFGGGHRVAEQH